MTSSRLSNRTALVTGSTDGIGRGIAEALAAEGAHVVVSGRDPDRGQAVVAGVRAAGGTADFLAADLAGSASAARELAAGAVAVLGGRLDILVNNVGIYDALGTLAITDEQIDTMLTVNIRAPHVLTAAVVPAMIDRGEGVVINLGSWISTVGMPSGALYSATKAAVEQLTRAWAAEFGPHGVRVNAIAPGVTLTGGTSASQEALETMVSAFPAGRLGTPADIAAAAVFLASDDASFVHGSTFVVDGGALATRLR